MFHQLKKLNYSIKKLFLKNHKRIKWFIPFSHSIETIGSSSSFTNEVDSNNLKDRIQWIVPNKDKIIKLEKELNDDQFIIANLDMAGFYRVNYDFNNWKLIAKQLLTNRDVNKF